MAIRLHINKEDLAKQEESELHLMPCKIHGDQAANVSSYFKPYICKVDEEHCDCSFRGYPLQGKKIIVPAGYKGMTFMENKKADPENKIRNLYRTGTFSQFTYWNYDRIPSKNDALVAALDWIDIAEVVANYGRAALDKTVSTARTSLIRNSLMEIGSTWWSMPDLGLLRSHDGRRHRGASSQLISILFVRTSNVKRQTCSSQQTVNKRLPNNENLDGVLIDLYGSLRRKKIFIHYNYMIIKK